MTFGVGTGAYFLKPPLDKVGAVRISFLAVLYCKYSINIPQNLF